MSPRILPPNILEAAPSDTLGSLFRTKALKSLAATTAAAALFSTGSEAAPTVPSIAIKFGTDQPVAGTTVEGPAGVLNTVNWNNFAGPNQAVPQTLNLDVNSGSLASTATVVWSSAGTWASYGKGEENNTGTGENRELMGGYLDTTGLGGTPVRVDVTGLNSSGFTIGYDVYVYIQGGVNGRGGTYTLGGVTDTHATTAAFTGTFIEDTDVAGTTPDSNYLVFRNVTGDAVTLTATPTIGNPARAPVNAIEIVAVPEPTALSALLGGCAVLLGLRRRRKA